MDKVDDLVDVGHINDANKPTLLSGLIKVGAVLKRDGRHLS